jgi:hypothetical protein
MNEEVIENNIRIIADGLDRDLPENEIIEAYVTVGFTMADVTLLLAAAKLLLSDRKNAQPVRGTFRRVT